MFSLLVIDQRSGGGRDQVREGEGAGSCVCVCVCVCV